MKRAMDYRVLALMLGLGLAFPRPTFAQGRLALEVAVDRSTAVLDGLLDSVVELIEDIDLAKAATLLVCACTECKQAGPDGEHGDDAPSVPTAAD